MSSSHRKQLLRYQHPFESFAEVRSHIACEALVDGKDFFDKSFSLINDATDSIFMSCWWLSPFIHLKRDSLPLKDEDRLCNLLWKKADEGIQIYVIIWNNSLFLSLCSEEAKEILEADHPNIHIMRDPAFSLPNFLWSHHQKFTCIDFTKAIVGGLDYAVGRYDTFNHELTDLGDSRPESYSEPTKDIVHRFSRCRMPWHDVSVAIEGLAAYDVAVNFIERWNHHRKSHTFEHLPKIGLPKAPALPPSGIAGRGRFTCEVQIIRSLGDWSGLQGRTTEASVYGAYMAAISKAQHYIYIENQYIVSSTAGGGVENRIIVAILDRIKDAIKNKRKFRVFIMFPIPEETGKPANHMLQLSYQTLFRGGLSLLDQFKLEFPDLDAFDYVGFYFLRTYGILPSGKEMSSNDNTQGDEEFEWKCVTDMVFVHSKIMLVDDEIAIIASNNLNDRSMLGNRDSELGAVVLDTKRVSMNMDNKKFTGRRFAHDLRVKLWREHLGLLNKVYDQHPWVQQLSQDPICDATYHGIFRKVAKLNTGIFKQIFPHIPSNSFNTFQEWEEFNLQVKNGKIKSPKNELLYKLNDLRGTLCFHPTRFCHSDSLDWSILEDIMGNELVS
ncbi:phospholipase D/nuclease [Neoconidiobolus thromboides FSU 785]|nr:phospholipase D/nuclease [Neoconidiobolus thromboides FSU 785]